MLKHISLIIKKCNQLMTKYN